jgi:hypothetical protein
MPVSAKVSISISSEDLAWAKKRARTGAKSLSAVVSDALRRQRQAEARVELLDELGTADIAASDLSAMRSELRGPRARGRVSVSRARKKRKP